MNKFLSHLILPLFLILCIASCDPYNPTDNFDNTPGTEISDLQGKEWKLVNFTSTDGEEINFDSDFKWKIRFAPTDTVSGFAGCNGYKGTYTATDKGSIEIDDLFSTDRGCPAGDVEIKFHHALSATTKFEVSKETLRLYFGEGGLLTFNE